MKTLKDKYPDFFLWDKDVKENQKIKIINAMDFPLNKALSTLGIDQSPLKESFGINNVEEIMARSELIKFLIEHPAINDSIMKLRLDINYPTKHDSFLEFFNPTKKHNPFWESLYSFMELLKPLRNELPKRLLRFLEIIEVESAFEPEENAMGKWMIEQIEKITVIEGMMECYVNLRESYFDPGVYNVEIIPETEQVHGYQMFSSSKLRIENQFAYLPWMKSDNSFIHWLLKPFRKQRDKQKEKALQGAYQGMAINKASTFLKEDICDAIRTMLNKLNWERIQRAGLYNNMLKAYIRFSYSKEGLQIHIYGLETTGGSTCDYFDFDNFKGYSAEQQDSIALTLQTYKEVMRRREKFAEGFKLENLLLVSKDTGGEPHKKKEYTANFFKKSHQVSSYRTDQEYRWFALDLLYGSPTCLDTFTKGQDLRSYIKNHMIDLKDIGTLAASFMQKAKEFKSTLSMPEILNNGHQSVSFDEIYPLHLSIQGKVKDLVAISNLPEVNGQILVITGKHGGGKSTSGITILLCVYLACSGLPILGKGFRTNVKKILGLVVNEDGQGSTATVLVQKMKNLLESLSKAKNSEVLLFFDELGKGTQEDSGLQLGKDLMNTLSKKKVSVIFNTQILPLAEFVRDDLDGICFKVDSNHHFDEGIGDGGMTQLRNKIGIDKYLIPVN